MKRAIAMIRKPYRFAVYKVWSQFAYSKLGSNILMTRLPNECRVEWVPHRDENDNDAIRESLEHAGISVNDLWVVPDDYKQYINEAQYPKGIYGENFLEKSLEHFLACKLLAMSSSDVYIDIANAGSPVPEIVQRLYGCSVYRQDLIYPSSSPKQAIQKGLVCLVFVSV